MRAQHPLWKSRLLSRLEGALTQRSLHHLPITQGDTILALVMMVMLKRSNICKKAEKDLGLTKVDGYIMYS